MLQYSCRRMLKADNKRGGGQNNGGSEFQKKDKCLILMLNLEVNKQTRSEASKNKESNNQKSIKHINKLSKSK